jgi:hypothetical protein
MKMTRWTKVGMAVLIVSLVLWGVLMLSTPDATRTDAAVAEEGHCPQCGQELPKAARAAGAECPYCKAMGRGQESGPRGGAAVLRGDNVPIVLGCALGALVVTHVVLLLRQRAAARYGEVLYYTNCRKCARRIRYRERQAGHFARCPVCQTVLVFPKVESSRLFRWPPAFLGKLLRR